MKRPASALEAAEACGLPLEVVAERARMGLPYLKHGLRYGFRSLLAADRVSRVLGCDVGLFSTAGKQTPGRRGAAKRPRGGSPRQKTI